MAEQQLLWLHARRSLLRRQPLMEVEGAIGAVLVMGVMIQVQNDGGHAERRERWCCRRVKIHADSLFRVASLGSIFLTLSAFQKCSFEDRGRASSLLSNTKRVSSVGPAKSIGSSGVSGCEICQGDGDCWREATVLSASGRVASLCCVGDGDGASARSVVSPMLSSPACSRGCICGELFVGVCIKVELSGALPATSNVDSTSVARVGGVPALTTVWLDGRSDCGICCDEDFDGPFLSIGTSPLGVVVPLTRESVRIGLSTSCFDPS